MGNSFSEVGNTSRKKQAHRKGGPDLTTACLVSTTEQQELVQERLECC
jgi:hypothetical protein